MRFYSLLMLVVFGAATLGEFLAPHRAPLIETLRIQPTGMESARQTDILGVVGYSTLRLQTTSDSYSIGGHIEVEAAHGLLFAAVFNRDSPIPLGPGYPNCTSSTDTNGHWSCRIPFRFDGSGGIDIAAVGGKPVLYRIKAVIVKASPRTTSGLESLFTLFAALSALALLSLGVPRGVDVKTRSGWLAAVGAIWLLCNGLVGAVLLAAFLGGQFLLLRLQLRAQKSHIFFAVSFAFVICAFLLVRLAIPFSWRAFANPGSLDLEIPLGFAFMVIRAADVVLRVATREVHEISFTDYTAYMLFPPTLAAGPIMTLPQFAATAVEKPGLVDWSAGAARVSIGVCKKILADVLLARIVAPKTALLYADTIAIAPDDLAALLFANALYVYLDFSAYSDIAIGIGRQLGWRVPENFNFPLLRSRMRTFWQSWHITLSVGVSRWIHFFCSFNLRKATKSIQASGPVIASLLIIGLWHEMQWTWLFWGIHHALGILLGDAGRACTSRWALFKRPPVVILLRIVGILFVWSWLALSQCFTLISDPTIALTTYVGLLTP
jgi:alginate O-acetyltransferase complex protein AlgI